jgi:hypothetical protein
LTTTIPRIPNGRKNMSIDDEATIEKLVKRLRDDVEVDSVDSLICACGTPLKGWLAVVLRASR